MKISILKPSDQPLGKVRLIEELRNNLNNSIFNEFKLIVAYAKIVPLLKIDSEINNWISNGKIIDAIFGIDQKGTSFEALKYALEKFSNSFIVYSSGKFSPTFHPKLYFFIGSSKAIVYIGSNNLTVGGTELNFESYLKIELNLPNDDDFFNELVDIWSDTASISVKLDRKLLSDLYRDELVERERKLKSSLSSSGSKRKSTKPTSFPHIQVQPPLPYPKHILAPKRKVPARKKKLIQTSKKIANISTTALVIQVVPHHNGEVLLSKIAIDQNPTFFGWPFTGSTTPKKSTNPSYPQRTPDPVVNLFLYDVAGTLLFSQSTFNLNTVYYSKKSEIRLTIPQDIVGYTNPYINSPYPVLFMSQVPPSAGYDYDLEFYLPGSKQYNKYLTLCNQSMPSGGKKIARKFGWV